MERGYAPARDPRRGRNPDDLYRLMAKIARMYHERGMRQSEIAAELHVSQPRVSRLLKRASEVGIVRTTIALPPGVHTDLEEALEQTYGLAEAVVVDAGGSDDFVISALGAATGHYLETTLTGGEVVGISSWSATLLAAVEAMRPARVPVVDTVVQVVGGVGDPRVQMEATRLIGLFASGTGASPVFMPAPGMLGTAPARNLLVADPTVSAVMDIWPGLTMVLVGIGSLEPSPCCARAATPSRSRTRGCCAQRAPSAISACASSTRTGSTCPPPSTTASSASVRTSFVAFPGGWASQAGPASTPPSGLPCGAAGST